MTRPLLPPFSLRNIDLLSRPFPNVAFENEVTTNTKFIVCQWKGGTKRAGNAGRRYYTSDYGVRQTENQSFRTTDDALEEP